ncbi:MAG: hypothetical protein MI861_27145, partial [Pirellulales bacterium]|nr:hypothetical protein [Pirellulales bacterium]
RLGRVEAAFDVLRGLSDVMADWDRLSAGRREKVQMMLSESLVPEQAQTLLFNSSIRQECRSTLPRGKTGAVLMLSRGYGLLTW